jgi:hypothetical protein
LALALAIGGARAETAPTPTREQYTAVKTVMQRLYDKGDRNVRSLLGTKGPYDLYHCSLGADYLGEGVENERATAGFANVAFDDVVWSNNLTKLGYPANLWSDLLAAYEAKEVDLIISADEKAADAWTERRSEFLNGLRKPLDAFRRTKRGLRPVVVEGGCGAGEMSVTIETEPKGGQVLFIPTFFYELCRVQNVNPDDTTGCNRWREAVDGKLASVSGDYLYVVHWPDGATRRGKLSFNKLEDGQTVTLKKP